MEFGFECKGCGNVFIDASLENQPCPSCGADYLFPVVITPCEGGLSCNDETHHLRIGAHAAPLELEYQYALGNKEESS